MASAASKSKSKPKWKPRKGVTWREKLERDHPSHGKIVEIPAPWRKSMGAGTMVIPRPLDVDRVMRTARKGRVITMGQLRKRLARKAGVDHACPLTTGIFVRIAAEAAEEDRRAGKKRITPWWRTVRDDGAMLKKCPGGPGAQSRHLRREGAPLKRLGKSLRVALG